MATTPKLERVCGVAALAPVRKGTGSAHQGVVIETAEGERFELVRIDGNPFADAVTRALAGHRVEAQGYRLGSTFRFTSAQVVD